MHGFKHDNFTKYNDVVLNEELDRMLKIFKEMVDLFDLPSLPQRIEIYDNSHNQGQQAYGVMVVATPQGFEKKSYRRSNTCMTFSVINSGLRRHFEPEISCQMCTC